MDELKNYKIERVLGIYTKLMNGCLVNKAEEAQNYGVNERSIQRDIDDIAVCQDSCRAEFFPSIFLSLHLYC